MHNIPLQTVKLSATIEGRKVLDGIDMELQAGEWMGLTGRSGAGKSVLGKTLAGLAPGNLQSGGEILFQNDKVSSHLSPGDVRKRKLSYMPQDPAASFNPIQRIGTQIEEVYCKISGYSRGRARDLSLELLGKMDFEDPQRIHHSYPHELSGGQAQRALLCMLAAKDPSVFILDEPTTDLDLITEKDVLDLIRKIADEIDAAVLFITHDITILSEYCSRILVLSEGRLVEEWETGKWPKTPSAQSEAAKGLLDAFRSLHRKSSATTREDTETASSDEELLKVSALTKEYVLKRHFLDFSPDKIKALEKFDFEFKSGLMYGVLGSSGSGKSTLASILSGMNASSSGSFNWRGKSLDQEAYRKVVRGRNGVQHIYQNPFRSFDPTKTMRFSLKEAATNYMPLGEEAFEKLREKCAVDVEWLHRYPHALSGGQLQRLAVLRALLMEPAVLLADECTSALDMVNQLHLMELFEELTATLDMSVIFFSHQISLLIAYCDEILVLKEGRLVETGPPSSLVRQSEHPFFETYRDLMME